MRFINQLLCGVASMSLVGGVAQAQDAPEADNNVAGVHDIVVTAQKREQAINSVGMSITAASGDTLLARGVTSPADLARVVPGFTFTASGYATPVYTLRGVGLYDYSFGASPSVALYQDEFSIPYPTMSLGLGLDVQRLEVLKGPQGTLYGASSTGGAINYIANKPTDTLTAGGDLSYDSFNKLDVSGFVSGPLSSTLKGRIAVRAVQGGDWQYSLSRPEDKNGASRQLIGRAILDWEPTSNAKFELTLSGYQDKSDTQQAQFISNQLNIVPTAGFIPAGATRSNPFEVVNPTAYAAFTNPASPNFDASLAGRQAKIAGRIGEPGTNAYLSTPAIGLGKNARVAEWSPEFPHQMDDRLLQAALRSTFNLSDTLTLTSLTSYIDQKIDRTQDNDATLAEALPVRVFGGVKFFNQELRLAYDTDTVHLVGGLNYDHSKVDDTQRFLSAFDLSVGEALPGLRFTENSHELRQKISNYAVFGNADVEVVPNLTLQAGARWTKSKRDAEYCGYDLTPAQLFSKTFGNADVVPGFGFYDLQSAFGLNPAGHLVVGPGQCIALNDSPTAGANLFRPAITPIQRSLDEDNVSWRFGANYKFDGGTLVYVSVSQGYKSGVFGNVAATAQSQFQPAKQERLRAYEFGFKAPLLDRRAQFNASAFYYDYADKQVRAKTSDPVFGLLENILNVPKSKVLGIEAELQLYPVEGLNISLSGSYLDAKVNGKFDQTIAGLAIYNQAGYKGDYNGSALPFTPKYSAVVDAEYKFPISGSTKAFFGGTLTYQDKTNATFETSILKADEYRIPSYTLLDLRAGIEAADGAWKASVFGRNVGDKVYATTIFSGSDVLYRYTGRAATYGATVSFRY
ncbi:TonB-dependent receptor [Sphingobium sp. CECT 9361]|uniref:TonB-dependent receptor n=1 Tax=Sphingobium sp. CECT 9361 TaxID=2845384 RepID=UPI001E472CEB|nr:TonB-dependent receptor [Sphingobium sp. CECT 9361]CAH0357084.1 Vitamin B12 transporter BtuB [Sphingobium sp. CECT 9361]